MSDISFDAISSDAARAAYASDPHDRKWSPRRTLAFIVVSSVLLWSLILAPFILL
jgi:hypothetical protein